MTKKIGMKRESKADKFNKELRQRHWPKLPKDATWDRHKATGFTTIPRCLSHVMLIMDSLSSGKPVSATYFTLWCHARDQHVLDIRNPNELAYESGFGGQRAESTWRERMKILQELGFILAEKGRYGDFTYVVILNPFHVIDHLNSSGGIQNAKMDALLDRLSDVGADEIKV